MLQVVRKKVEQANRKLEEYFELLLPSFSFKCFFQYIILLFRWKYE